MKHILISLILAFTIAGTLVAAEYPSRNITAAVVWGAGGGTDSAVRIVANEMNEFLPTRINVVNKTGGVAGSAGMLFGYSKPADGYTIVGISESNVTAAVNGGWDKKFSVWYPFIIGGSPDLISVNVNSPFETLDQLISAAKTNPKSIKAAAGGAGSIHHLNLLALENGTDAEFSFIPYKGSAPGQNAAITGEVTVVVTSLAEQQQLLKAKKLRPLAMLVKEDTKVDGVGTIPSAFSTVKGLDKYLPISQAIGMGIRSDAPAEAKEALTEAFNKALATDKVKQWAADNFFTISGQTGDEASATFAGLESLFSWTLHELGAAKVDPSSLNIPKP